MPCLWPVVQQLQVLTDSVHRPLWRLGSVPLIWWMVVVSYVYGHASAVQAQFEQGRLSRIVGAVSRLQVRMPTHSAIGLIIEGVMPRSPMLQNTAHQFPLIDRLITPLLRLSADPVSQRPLT